MAERRAIVYEIEVETEIEEDGAGGPEDLDLQRLCLGILWPSSVRTCMRSRSRPRSSVFATTLPFQLTLPILVISSGGSMHNDSIGKNRYSYDESRNLSSKCL